MLVNLVTPHTYPWHAYSPTCPAACHNPLIDLCATDHALMVLYGVKAKRICCVTEMGHD